MKKNLLITILTIFLCLFMVVPVLAEGEDAENGFADEYYRLLDVATESPYSLTPESNI